jgi:hypothetical protein
LDRGRRRQFASPPNLLVAPYSFSGGPTLALLFKRGVVGYPELITDTSGAADFAGAFDQNVMFTGPGVLELEHSQSYGGTVSGFGLGDAIDLNDLAYSANESLTWTQDGDDGVLTVDDNGGTEHITLDGDYSFGEFA